MATAVLSDRDVLAALGTEALVGAGYTALRVKMWKQRGISWPERGKVAALAEQLSVKVPEDFLTHRRTVSRPARKARRTRKAA